MLEVKRDDKGNMTAVCEYLLFNKLGQLTEEGETMFIGELEINPEHRGNGILKGFIKTLLTKYPKAEQCFFYRRKKYPDRDYRVYTREQFELLTRR